MHTDMTAVPIQSNKIISNKVKDNEVLLEPSYEKTKQTFWPTQYNDIPYSGILFLTLFARKFFLTCQV